MVAGDGDLHWYVSRDGGQHGPLSTRDMVMLAEAGHLLASDYVWMTGAPDWVPAGSVEGLVPAPVAPRQLGFSEALALQGRRGLAAEAAVDRRAVDSHREPSPLTDARYVPHLARSRSLTRLSEGSALASWQAARQRPLVPASGAAAAAGSTAAVAWAVTATAEPVGAVGWQQALAEVGPPAADRAPSTTPAIGLPVVPDAAAELQAPQAAQASGAGLMSQVSGLLGAVRGKVDDLSAWAPAHMQSALGQMHAFGWSDLVGALAAAFAGMNIRTLDDLMDDMRMRNVARLMLDHLPWSARTCISLTIGEEGMERLVLGIRDWLRARIPAEQRGRDIGPLVNDMLGSEAIALHFRTLFDDLKTRLILPLASRQALPTTAPMAMLPAPGQAALMPA